jgi:D-alanyl-D-alanine carboxypeptidase (penicillin-binding protein 5/6)
MKYWLGLAVILLHVALLAAFFGPWQRRTRDTAAAPERPLADPVPSPPRPAVPSNPSAVTAPRTPVAKATAGVTGLRSAGEAFSPSFFRRALRPLPAKLETAAASCRSGIVVDWSARALLWAKAETRAVPIASLTKMMTVLVVVQELERRPDVSLDTPVTVTPEAHLIGGRQVWLDPRETFPLQDILRAALIHSANDAAYLLAQRLSGSETAFVQRMHEKANALGLESLVFNNAHGLPDGPTKRENLGSAIDLAYLAGCLLAYPKVVEWSSTRLTYLEPRVDGTRTQLGNTNHLVGRVAGVNGMKTGFTDKSGFCLVATCERQGRQIITVVTGCSRAPERDELATALIEWAYAAP